MLKMKTIVAAAALMTAPMMAQADDGLSFSGYADLSAQTNNRDTINGSPIAKDNSFSVDQVSLTVSKAPVNGFSGLLTIVGGEDVAGGAASGFSSTAITQGYFQYNNGGLTFTGGKFFTLCGYEVFASTGNAQISRSMLFGIQPFNHTGVRASYALSDAMTVTASLVNTAINGNDTVDTNKQKTIEVSLGLTPMKGLSFAVTGHAGTEIASGFAGSSNIIDVVASWQLSDAFSLGLNADFKKVETSATTEDKTSGVAIYGGLQLSDSFKLSLRAESLKFETTGGADLKPSEITVTGGYAMAKNFDLLAEIRTDDADAKIYDGGTQDKATTLAVKGIFKF